jgi:hypothetical protein
MFFESPVPVPTVARQLDPDTDLSWRAKKLAVE